MYSTENIGKIIDGQQLSEGSVTIAHLLYDSRKIQHPSASLFFAIQTAHNDGHKYIEAAYKKGVRAFVVSEKILLPDAVIILVDDTLKALQTLAAYHRSQFHLPVIGITGSNGKTVVKEWLNSLLEEDFSIVRSPKSFNSQLGVALSVWEIEKQNNLGIFEAGISQPGEMKALQKMIQPTIGVFTTLGEAHSEGFASAEEKLFEKQILFEDCDVVIGPKKFLQNIHHKTITWSSDNNADVQVLQVKTAGNQSTIEVRYGSQQIHIAIPFADEASIQNATTCLCVLLYLGISKEKYVHRFLHLHPVDMRLQLNHAINHCLLINDSYSADLTSLQIALHFLVEQSSGKGRTVILSDFVESGKSDEELYSEIAQLLFANRIQKLLAIGEQAGNYLRQYLPTIAVESFLSTEDFITQFRSSQFSLQIILLKGARRFGFESIAELFEEKRHGTVLQINLTALAKNLKEYQIRLKPSTKIMAMVKAFSYGSGGAEIASVLQFYNVAYLGVAYADEGVELVKAGIALPIMVMNPEPASYAAIIDHNLQPVLYSWPLLKEFEAFVKSEGLTAYPVHIEIETGMNRLGFATEEMENIGKHLAASNTLHLQSAFSHLAASEDASQDDFTRLQAERFTNAVKQLQAQVSYPFLKHISNSAAIVRHPSLQMDMVRLGIGLYGIEADAEDALSLEPVATLRSTIAQIKELKAGESVSYNRRGIVHRHSKIATVRIGYADGYSRRFSNGVGKMLVQDQLVPVIGTVCMDMTMIDVTDVAGVKEGDDVIVFGKEVPVQQVAAWAGTIAYEIMTSVSQRVKRVYYYE